MSIAAVAQRNRAAIYLLVAFLVVAGLVTLRLLPAGIYPEVTYPRIVVLARGGTFEARDMTVGVTRPVEEAMSGIIDLARIRSRTVRGGSEISLDFRPSADMAFALQQVQGRLASLQPSPPPDVEVTAERLTPSVFPMIQYELTGASPTALRELAQYVILPRLIGLPDVGSVDVQGGLVREVSVVLDPDRLINNRLTVDDVASAIADANVVTAAGRVDRAYLQYSVTVSGLTETPAAVAAVVVAERGTRAVRVGDVGRVRYGTEDQFQIVSGNGEPAALINIGRQPNGNALVIQTAVRQAIDSLRSQLPSGTHLNLVYDQAALVRESMGSVRDAMIVGGVLAVVVLLVFLGAWRTTVAAALTLPLSVLGTFVGLKLTGQSLNLMSLGGLAVAIGLIIDDAVVVVENIERRLAEHPGEPAAEVIRRGTDEIFGPVAGSTLTTVVVFAPLGLLEGVVGEFFRAFSIALALSVLLSLVLAMTVIPAVVAHWHRARVGFEATAAPRWRLSLVGLERGYARVLRAVLRYRRVAVAGVMVLAAAAWGLAQVTGTGFLPEMDEGGFILDYWTPTGSSLAETDREVKIIERILAQDPEVQAFSRRTGTELGFAATAPNRGDMTVLLRPRGVRKVSVYKVMDRVRARVEQEVPSARVEFIQLLQDVIGDLAGAPAPIEVKLFSRDHRAAEAAARLVASAIASVPGLVDLFDGIAGDNPESRITLDPNRVGRLGLSDAQVASQARAALFGAPAGHVREPDRLVAIRARLPDSIRYRMDVVWRVPIIGPHGWAPLGALGTVADGSETSELLRENLRPYVAVTGRVSGSNLGAVMARIRRALRGLPLPPGVTLQYGGQYASQQVAFRQFLVVFALATAAVLLVLVVQFRTIRGPVVILLAAPLGITGALAGLLATGVAFNVSSFMGLILLIGLVVKNSILLLDAAQIARDAGVAPEEAVTQAGTHRLRPILMTTLCTLAGLTPLAIGWGAGAELQRPLAIAVMGGLTVSTAVTLIFLPIGLTLSGALRHHGRDRSEPPVR